MIAQQLKIKGRETRTNIFKEPKKNLKNSKFGERKGRTEFKKENEIMGAEGREMKQDIKI